MSNDMLSNRVPGHRAAEWDEQTANSPGRTQGVRLTAGIAAVDGGRPVVAYFHARDDGELAVRFDDNPALVRGFCALLNSDWRDDPVPTTLPLAVLRLIVDHVDAELVVADSNQFLNAGRPGWSGSRVWAAVRCGAERTTRPRRPRRRRPLPRH